MEDCKLCLEVVNDRVKVSAAGTAFDLSLLLHVSAGKAPAIKAAILLAAALMLKEQDSNDPAVETLGNMAQAACITL